MTQIMQKDDVEKLEMEYSKELAERREIAINYKGQVAGRHPDLFGHSEMQHMIRGYLEGFEKAKSIMYTKQQLSRVIALYLEGLSFSEIIESLKQH